MVTVFHTGLLSRDNDLKAFQRTQLECQKVFHILPEQMALESACGTGASIQRTVLQLQSSLWQNWELVV